MRKNHQKNFQQKKLKFSVHSANDLPDHIKKHQKIKKVDPGKVIYELVGIFQDIKNNQIKELA